jgi:ribonuclease P protein component
MRRSFAMPDRLIHKADFESLMSAPTWSRSAHFSVHHVARRPHSPSARRRRADSSDLSTDLSEPSPQVVDKLPERIWIGAMVPKRQARRAVMRNLLKRQIRNAFERHDALLPRGLWLVRLRRGFAAADFVSASSRRLAEDVRAELDELLRRVPPPPRRATSPR